MPVSGGAPVQVTTGGAHWRRALDGKSHIILRLRRVIAWNLSPFRKRRRSKQIIPDAISGWWALTNRGIYFASIPMTRR
jgi:hypothetical protein